MNKKGKNIELKIYELLGVKKFKKMLIKFVDLLCIPIAKRKGIPVEEEINRQHNKASSNYFIKKGTGIKGLKDFKEQLFFNAAVHFMDFVFSLAMFLLILSTTIPVVFKVWFLFSTVLNAYCVMLQRYNHIRISKVIKKGKQRDDIKKNELEEQLINDKSLLENHTYKIINSRGKEKSITYEELLRIVNYKQLKQYYDYLCYLKARKDMNEEHERNFFLENPPSISLPRNKILKIELK